MNGLRIAVGLLRTPRLGPFLIGRTLAATAIWMERIALGWLIWEATGSAAWVGALAFLRLAPGMVFGPWGGVLADRRGGIAVLRGCYAALALVSAAAAVAVAAGIAGPVVLMLVGTLSGALQSLAAGPLKSAITEVAPRRVLATAVPVASVTFNAAAFVGPAIAGAMIAAAGAAAVFAAVAVLAAGFAAVLAGLPAPVPAPAPARGALRAVAEAGGVAARHPLIGPLMALHIAFSLLMRPIVELLPAVVGGLAGGGSTMLGLLTGATGIGAFAGSLWLTWRSGSPRLVRPVLGAAGLACAAVLALAAGTGATQAALALATLGGALVVRAAGGTTLVQLAVADAYRGRILAIWGTVLRVGAAAGGAVLGVAADAFGIRAAMAVAALLALACLIAVLRRLRAEAL